jgi:DNA-binding FadR family transcriptional regulator
MDDKIVYFTPVSSKRTFEEIFAEMKQLIIEGVFKPGDKLPSEMEIARQFNVGWQTVREALRLLELSGFLKVRKGAGGGSTITNAIPERLSKSFLDAARMANMSISELTVARIGIEKLVVSLAVGNATDEDIALLNENVQAATRKIEQGIQAFEENIDFHVLLAKASHNSAYTIIVGSIMTVVAHFFRVPQMVATSKKIVDEHKGILDAVIERNEERAVSLMDKHICLVRDQFNLVKSRPAKAGKRQPRNRSK